MSGPGAQPAGPAIAGDRKAARRRLLITCLVLFLVALGIRLVYLHQLDATPFRDERGLIADVRYYDMRAREIAAGDLLPDVPGFLSPLYCYALGAVYAVVGPRIFAAKIVQAVLGALSCVLLYLIGRRLFSESVGRIAGALLACYATHVYYHGVLLPATLIVFLHLLLIWVLSAGWSLWRAGVAGGLIGLSVLAKANALLLCPAVSLWIWLVCPLAARRSRLVRIGLLCGLAAVTVAPITINNYVVSGSFLLVTTTGGPNLLKGNGPTATGTHAFLPPGAQATGVASHLQKRVDPREAARQSNELSARAWRYMREHPARTAGLAVKKLLLLANAYERGIRDQFHFVSRVAPVLRFGLPFWAVVPLGLVGACFALRDWRRLGPLYAVILVQVVSFVLIFVLARYRLVLVACLMPFAAWLLACGVEWLRDRRWRPLAAASLLLAGFLALSLVDFADLPRGRGFADQYLFVADHESEAGRAEAAAAAYEAASETTWVDPRRVEAQRWRALFRLAETQIELGRSDDALQTLDALAAEVERDYPGIEHPLEGRIEDLKRELARRAAGRVTVPSFDPASRSET